MVGKAIWLKLAGATLLVMGIVSVVLSFSAIFTVPPLTLFYQVREEKLLYALFILLCLAFGMLNCLIGDSLFKLNRLAIHAAAVLSVAVILISAFFILMVGYPSLLIKITFLVYLFIFVITLMAALKRGST